MAIALSASVYTCNYIYRGVCIYKHKTQTWTTYIYSKQHPHMQRTRVVAAHMYAYTKATCHLLVSIYIYTLIFLSTYIYRYMYVGYTRRRVGLLFLAHPFRSLLHQNFHVGPWCQGFAQGKSLVITIILQEILWHSHRHIEVNYWEVVVINV